MRRPYNYLSPQNPWPVRYDEESTIQLLVVGAGGGGSAGVNAVNYGSGAAGGTVKSYTAFSVSPQEYTVTVGAKGLGQAGTGQIGGSSIFSTVTATGGVGPTTGRVGGANADFSGGTGVGGTNSGGGAGAGANGSAGNGGNGVQSSISGTATYYGGGGAGVTGGLPATPGLGGGGVASTTGKPAAADANTGGGGGGGSPSFSGGDGADGVVIIAFKEDGSTGVSTSSTGGTITSSGGYQIHTFNTTSTWTMVKA